MMSRAAASDVTPLTLGTVQLGMDYGLVASSTRPDDAAVEVMLDRAWAAGIRAFDTAPVYGDAETRLGAWIAATRRRPFVVSKLAPLPSPLPDDIAAHVGAAIAASLDRLGIDRLDGYLVHRVADIEIPGVADALRAAVEAGRIGGFGVSVYAPDELERALAIAGLTMAQIPVSLADQRFARSGALNAAAARGVTVFARSVYLQGVLLLTPEALPPVLAPLAEPLRAFRQLAATAGLAVNALALHAVLDRAPIASAVVGVATPAQLDALLAAWRTTVPRALLDEARVLFAGLPEAVLDIRRW